MYALLTQHFAPAGRTADIGCGAGRDVAWLNANGVPAVGHDASFDAALVATAMRMRRSFQIRKRSTSRPASACVA
ncbi:hypothetical protein WJ79_26935 [Burkholderia ubonensis]|nr:hypothetical protein WJ79_26935 [Burkholderia ubonensis]